MITINGLERKSAQNELGTSTFFLKSKYNG